MKPEEFTQSLQTLGTRYLEEYTRAMQRYLDTLNAASGVSQERESNGSGDLQAMQKRYAEFVASQAPQVLSALSEAGLRYYTTLADLGLQTINGYITTVLDAQPPAAVTEDNKRNALVFHGTRGESANNAFMVSNNRNVAIDVAFDIAEVVSSDGKTKFKPQARFTPDKCRLAPHSEQVVQCELPLGGKFKAGEDYEGSIAVVGFPEMSMRFCVTIEPKAKQQPARKASAARKPATPRKTTRGKTGG